MRIRPDEPADWPVLYNLYISVFGQSAEVALVQRLRPDGDLVLSLVASQEKPVGHIVFSRLTLKEDPSVKGCVLAPLVIASSHQKQGIGSMLLKESLDQLREAGFDLVTVLGDPRYFGRHGFTPELARRFKAPFKGPYVQALALSEKGKMAYGPVTYARVFAELTL